MNLGEPGALQITQGVSSADRSWWLVCHQHTICISSGPHGLWSPVLSTHLLHSLSGFMLKPMFSASLIHVVQKGCSYPLSNFLETQYPNFKILALSKNFYVGPVLINIYKSLVFPGSKEFVSNLPNILKSSLSSLLFTLS